MARYKLGEYDVLESRSLRDSSTRRLARVIGRCDEYPLIIAIGERVPSIAEDALIAPGAVIAGDVHLLARSSVSNT